MRNVILIFLLLFTNSCLVEFQTAPRDSSDGTSYNVYYDICYEEEPYLYSADICHYHSDGVCCEWYTESGCYEEWCNWNDFCGWEYIISYSC